MLPPRPPKRPAEEAGPSTAPHDYMDDADEAALGLPPLAAMMCDELAEEEGEQQNDDDDALLHGDAEEWPSD